MEILDSYLLNMTQGHEINKQTTFLTSSMRLSVLILLLFVKCACIPGLKINRFDIEELFVIMRTVAIQSNKIIRYIKII